MRTNRADVDASNVGFENIGSTPFRSDTGWGCMLRSGQMLLGETLVRHILSESTPEPVMVRAGWVRKTHGQAVCGRGLDGRLAAGP